MKKTFLIATFMLSMACVGFAQNYKTGVGLRGGWFNGITAKHFIKDDVALEGILSTRWSGFNFTGLYEVHRSAFDVEGLVWYYGGGGHIGFWNGEDVEWGSKKTGSYTVVGIDGIIGIEYTFRDIPLNLSIDWKPVVNLVGHSGFWGDGGAVSIRYVF